MQHRKLGKSIVARLEANDDVMASLKELVAEYEIGAASVQAIGALRRAVLGYFDASTNSYHHIPVEEHVEVVALLGNTSRDEDGQPMVHAHALLGQMDGRTLGGHLVEGVVYPTLEIILTPLEGDIIRRPDPETGLVLWSL